MSRRHVTLAARLTHDAATRFARRGYWLTLREAAAEVGVTRRRMSQLVEELDLAAPQVGPVHGEQIFERAPPPGDTADWAVVDLAAPPGYVAALALRGAVRFTLAMHDADPFTD